MLQTWSYWKILLGQREQFSVHIGLMHPKGPARSGLKTMPGWRARFSVSGPSASENFTQRWGSSRNCLFCLGPHKNNCDDPLHIKTDKDAHSSNTECNMHLAIVKGKICSSHSKLWMMETTKFFGLQVLWCLFCTVVWVSKISLSLSLSLSLSVSLFVSLSLSVSLSVSLLSLSCARACVRASFTRMFRYFVHCGPFKELCNTYLLQTCDSVDCFRNKPSFIQLRQQLGKLHRTSVDMAASKQGDAMTQPQAESTEPASRLENWQTPRLSLEHRVALQNIRVNSRKESVVRGPEPQPHWSNLRRLNSNVWNLTVLLLHDHTQVLGQNNFRRSGEPGQSPGLFWLQLQGRLYNLRQCCRLWKAPQTSQAVGKLELVGQDPLRQSSEPHVKNTSVNAFWLVFTVWKSSLYSQNQQTPNTALALSAFWNVWTGLTRLRHPAASETDSICTYSWRGCSGDIW